ncbi:MAG: choice-of-anchor Q domain-containing protein [Kofleriaceae bacterium]
MLRLALGVGLLIVVGCGTTKNPNFCCITAEDCQQAGEIELSPCAEGLACIDRTCVPSSCAMEGCTSDAPVCETATDRCVGCSGPADCARFSAMLVCDVDGGGSCVECVGDGDCPSNEPICDAKQCRVCENDGECPSGACGEDGACVPEANVVYLASDGVDDVPCSKTMPCKQLEFGIRQTTTTRNHIAFAPGTYQAPLRPHDFGSTQTTATSVVVHGHGAVIRGGSDDGFLRIGIPTTIRDLEIENQTVGSSYALGALVMTKLERVTLRGDTGMSITGGVVAEDLTIVAGTIGIATSGSLTINRARISGGQNAIQSTNGAVDITNMIAFGTTGTTVDLVGTSGTIAFSTVYNRSGTASPPGMHCQGPATIRASIIWTPVQTQTIGYTGACALSTSLVGPVSVAGGTNTDPLFVNADAGNFHLSGGSPARDMAPSGPSTDADGDPRPNGPGFDFGADEIQ